MNIMKETVAISLEKYESMKDEIKKLNCELQQKIIVKYYLPPIFGFVLYFLLFFGICLLEFSNKN